MSTKDAEWADYWLHDSAEGEVFVNAAGEKHPALADHWLAVFAEVGSGARVIDIASGAGSIFAHLPNDHGYELHASDIAAEALDTLRERLPGVTTHVASAAEMPFDDGAFDVVVSQFGIEYAGRDAFAEAARLVAAGGMLAAVAHVADGYIDGNNQAQLAEAIGIRDSGFVDEAIRLTRVAYRGNPNALAAREKEITPHVQRVEDAMRRCRQGVHTHLYSGFRQLYENRAQYDESDITGWLDGMKGEIDKTIDRLSRIRQAALSEEDVQAIIDAIRDTGFGDVNVSPFMTPGNEQPVAWNIRAHRNR